MASWQTTTQINGHPEHVIAVLTDPDLVRRWSPIEFDLEELEGKRLTAGSNARVSGRIAGQRVGFDIEVLAADESGLWLKATGPIEIEVEYEIEAREQAAEVNASVSVSGGGLMGRLLSKATHALLAAGALDTAMGRIAREVEAAPVALAA